MSIAGTTELHQGALVLYGGIVAIVSGVVSQLATHYFARVREREKLFLDKAEMLVSALYAQRSYMERQLMHLVYGGKEVHEPDPIYQVWALQSLYFPALQREKEILSEAISPMISFMYDQANLRLEDTANWQKTYNPKTYLEMHKNYLSASSCFIRAIAQSTRISSQGSTIPASGS